MSYWPAGLPSTLEYPRVTAERIIESAAALYPERVAVTDAVGEWTFRELLQESRRFANALRDSGVQEGDVVLLHLNNSRWFLVSYFGTLLAGAIVSPVNPLSPAASLVSQIRDTGAVVAVSQEAAVANLLEACRTASNLDTIVLAPGDTTSDADTSDFRIVRFETFVASASADAVALAVNEDDVAHIVYTGGTTGIPKGVRVLHRNLVANVTQMIGWRAGHAVVDRDKALALVRFPTILEAPIQPGEGTTVVVSPLFHAHALVNTNFLLLCGVTAVLSERFAPERLLDMLERRRVTYLTGSPAMWHALISSPGIAKRDLSSLRVLSSAAAPLDAQTLDRLVRLFPSAVVTESYGLTEGTCLVTAGSALRSATRKLGSVGLPCFDTEIQIRGMDPDPVRLPPGETGRIWIRGPQVTDGYWRNPTATREQFVDGWLDTGDVGFLDDEGFLYISDRAKDMLTYKGYNVYPRELEEVLCRHPDVQGAAVVGRDDPAVGQIPVAFVVPAPGTSPDVESLMAFVAQQVLPYKKVREVHLVNNLPTSTAGKILKTELRSALHRHADSSAD